MEKLKLFFLEQLRLMNKFKIFILIFVLNISSLTYAKSFTIGKDKVMHFSGSAFITYWNYSFSRNIMNLDKQNSYIISVSLSSLCGFLGIIAGIIVINTVGDL